MNIANPLPLQFLMKIPSQPSQRVFGMEKGNGVPFPCIWFEIFGKGT